MCVVSMIMDHYHDKWKPYVTPFPQMPYVAPVTSPLTQSDWERLMKQQPTQVPQQAITKEEIEEFRKLLDRARKYDKENHEPDCELQEKKDRLMKLAKELGVDISFVESSSG